MKNAIVIGASMTGLMASRVLSDHFDQVTVLDRDVLPQGPLVRKGVPQANHIHLLLRKGGRLVERFFPGITQALLDEGVPRLDAGADFLTISSFGPVAPNRSGLELMLCSRALLEWKVRERLQARPNVRIVPAAQVLGLLPGQNGAPVHGVRVKVGPEGRVVDLRGDLVVDVSGRHSKGSDWLQELGYPCPEVTRVDSFLGYATRWYERETSDVQGYKAVLISTRAPGNPRFGGILPAENGRWVCTLAGFQKNYPPTDDAGFLEFAGHLQEPIVRDFIAKAKPISPIRGYRNTQNVLRHYERLSRWPSGFITMGDAVCAFNPIYAQGMSVGALGAKALHDLLATQRPETRGFELQFQRKLAKVNSGPWSMAVAEDFRWPDTVGARPGPLHRIEHWLSDQVLKGAVDDEVLCRSFLEVVHLVRPRESLLRPRNVLRMLAG